MNVLEAGSTSWRKIDSADVDRRAGEVLAETLDASARIKVGRRPKDVGSRELQSLRSTTRRVDIADALQSLALDLTRVLLDTEEERHLPEPDPQRFDRTRLNRLRAVGSRESGDLATWYGSPLSDE